MTGINRSSSSEFSREGMNQAWVSRRWAILVAPVHVNDIVQHQRTATGDLTYLSLYRDGPQKHLRGV